MTRATRSLVRGAVSAFMLAGCGGPGGADRPDAAPPADAAVCLRAFEPSDLEMSDPQDFDRAGCVPGSLAALDPAGIWHLDRILLNGEAAANYGVIRFARASSGCLDAHINGWASDDVHQTDDDLLTRLQFSSTSEIFEWHTYDACSADDNDTLHGDFADCFLSAMTTQCHFGTFRAVRLASIAGEPTGTGIEKLGEWRGDAELLWTGVTVGVRAANGVAYVARREDGLRIVGVSDPTAPVELAWLPPAVPYEWYLSVELLPQPDGSVYAVVLSDTRGLVIVDVTDPTAPMEVATSPTPLPGDIASGRALSIETDADGTRAYLVRAPGWYSFNDYIDVIDLSAPATPALLGSYRITPLPFNGVPDLAVWNRRVYLARSTDGIEVLDASDPAAIVSLATFDDPTLGNAHAIAIAQLAGCHDAVVVDQSFGGSIQLVGVDEACPDYLQPLGGFTLRPEVAANDVSIAGDRAFVAYDQDGVRLLDLSDPSAPSALAHYVTWTGGPGDSFVEGALGVDLDAATKTIYVADSHAGLVILRDLSPAP